MSELDRTQQADNTRQRKFPVWALVLGVLFAIALVASIFLVGMMSSNPWGEAVGPGP